MLRLRRSGHGTGLGNRRRGRGSRVAPLGGRHEPIPPPRDPRLQLSLLRRVDAAARRRHHGFSSRKTAAVRPRYLPALAMGLTVFQRGSPRTSRFSAGRDIRLRTLDEKGRREPVGRSELAWTADRGRERSRRVGDGGAPGVGSRHEPASRDSRGAREGSNARRAVAVVRLVRRRSSGTPARPPSQGRAHGGPLGSLRVLSGPGPRRGAAAAVAPGRDARRRGPSRPGGAGALLPQGRAGDGSPGDPRCRGRLVRRDGAESGDAFRGWARSPVVGAVRRLPRVHRPGRRHRPPGGHAQPVRRRRRARARGGRGAHRRARPAPAPALAASGASEPPASLPETAAHRHYPLPAGTE